MTMLPTPPVSAHRAPHHHHSRLLILMVACRIFTVTATAGYSKRQLLAFVSQATHPTHPTHPHPTVTNSLRPQLLSTSRSNHRKRPMNPREPSWRLQESAQTSTASVTTPTSSQSSIHKNGQSQGLYRPFAEHAWNKLMSLLPDSRNSSMENPVPEDLRYNVAPAKGFPAGSTVDMETRAISSSSSSSNSLFRYARFALLETNVATVPTATASSNANEQIIDQTHPEAPSSSSSSSSSQSPPPPLPIGIQVLNFVIIPHQSHLPVWGVDLVSLPGDRHLMLMDAQPVQPSSRSYESHWKEWHTQHVVANSSVFPWGGDIPGEAAQYVSANALWTRLQGSESARSIVQGELWQAFCDHLDLYLQLLQQLRGEEQEQIQPNDGAKVNDDNAKPFETYLQYRLVNDPARPMLRALYGPEWTERVLHEVLFPNL